MNYKIPKGKRKKISHSEFLTHINYFKKETEKLGFKFTIKKIEESEKPEWSAPFNPTNCVGQFDETDKIIEIVYWDEKTQGYSDIIQTTAHEFRHLEHFIKGLFKPYYGNIRNFIEKYKNNKKKMHRFLNISHLAEKDCDHFGFKYLNKHNIFYRYSPYTYKMTISYDLWEAYR